jgi:hypothetical protein
MFCGSDRASSGRGLVLADAHYTYVHMHIWYQRLLPVT